MANRYVDTAIWDKAWYRSLSPELKAIFKFLTDKCDHAGVWEIDSGAFKYYVGSDLTVDQVLAVPAFSERFQKIQDKWFCPGFITYQYKTGLNPTNRVHLSVIQRLQKLGIDYKTFANQAPLQAPYIGAIEGSIDKDIEVDKELENRKHDIFAILKSEYPTEINLGPGVEALLPQINSPQDLINLRAAAKHFKFFHIHHRTDVKFIPHPKTWAKTWTEWIEYDGEPRERINLVGVEHKKLLAEMQTGSTEEGLQKALSDPELQKKLVKIGFKNKNKRIYENENES